ncbi:MAG: hypothetical protein KAW88_02140 [Candidatus Cloacimonetes bacterium]|nr:hypothetical protein [Candidatus Cloacimonadota bacterium]
MKEKKDRKQIAIRFTIIGLTLSIIGQAFIGKSRTISIILTMLGVGFAAFGVILAFGLDRFFKR